MTDKTFTKYVYTINDARRECRELIKEGNSCQVHIFLNDLSRSGNISWEDNKTIRHEIINGTLFGEDNEQ